MFLTKEEEKMASGEYGETIRKSMDWETFTVQRNS